MNACNTFLEFQLECKVESPSRYPNLLATKYIRSPHDCHSHHSHFKLFTSSSRIPTGPTLWTKTKVMTTKIMIPKIRTTKFRTAKIIMRSIRTFCVSSHLLFLLSLHTICFYSSPILLLNLNVRPSPRRTSNIRIHRMARTIRIRPQSDHNIIAMLINASIMSRCRGSQSLPRPLGFRSLCFFYEMAEIGAVEHSFCFFDLVSLNQKKWFAERDYQRTSSIS